MSEKIPEYVFHQFDYLFDKMDGAHFGEAEIAGVLHGAKNNGIYPGADYVYRYIQYLQIRLREEKKKTHFAREAQALVISSGHVQKGDMMKTLAELKNMIFATMLKC